jgi:hypothetical protein
MKQAIRANRQGKRGSSRGRVAALADGSLRVVHDDHTPAVWFIGYAPEFEPLVVGQRSAGTKRQVSSTSSASSW